MDLSGVISKGTVRTGHGTTDWFQIGKGVRQGCILSPCLFNLYADYIMRNTVVRSTRGLPAQEQSPQHTWDNGLAPPTLMGLMPTTTYTPRATASHPWDSPGKNTGVGCHFLLQRVKVKSLSCARLLATPWTGAHQAPPAMGSSRQELVESALSEAQGKNGGRSLQMDHHDKQ